MNESNTTPSGTLVNNIARIVAGFNENPTKGSFAFGGQSHPVAPYAIVPEGFRVEPLKPAPVEPLPPHIIQTVTLNDTRSFCSYVNKFKETDTALFLDKSGKFVAVFDWHSAPVAYSSLAGNYDDSSSSSSSSSWSGRSDDLPSTMTATGIQSDLRSRWSSFPSPRRTSHRASFTLTHSEQWLFWAGLHDKWLTQQMIIEAFEGRRADISSPSDADLLKCASEIRSQEGVEMVARFERNSGQSVMVRKEAAVGTVSEETRVIGDMVLSIPCFENSDPTDISVLISWNGKLDKFVKIRLLELDRIKREQTAIEFEVVQTQTGITVLLGTPQ